MPIRSKVWWSRNSRSAASGRIRQRTIEDAQIIRLSVDDQRRFADLLINPPPLVPAMKRALKARQLLIAGVK